MLVGQMLFELLEPDWNRTRLRPEVSHPRRQIVLGEWCGRVECAREEVRPFRGRTNCKAPAHVLSHRIDDVKRVPRGNLKSSSPGFDHRGIVRQQALEERPDALVGMDHFRQWPREKPENFPIQIAVIPHS